MNFGSVDSFNNAYNKVNEQCRNLVTETTYKESVRFFESKNVDTDNVTYDELTYNVKGAKYQVREVKEKFEEDIRKAQTLGISIPEEHFIRADIRNYEAIGGYLVEFLEITRKNSSYGSIQDYNILVFHIQKDGTTTIEKTLTTTAPILPVVKLKSNVVVDTTKGEGTVESPYSLKINN